MGDHVFAKNNVAGTFILVGLIWAVLFVLACLLAVFVEGTADLSTDARLIVVIVWLMAAAFSGVITGAIRHA